MFSRALARAEEKAEEKAESWRRQGSRHGTDRGSCQGIGTVHRNSTQLGAYDDNLAAVNKAQDGLSFMTQITSIRNAIRSNIEQGLTLVVGYPILYRAVGISAAIREWRSLCPKNDLGDLVELLYKQMLWIYLWQTIYPLKSTSWMPERKITAAVQEGVALLKLFPPKDPVQALLLAPTFLIGLGAFDPMERGSVRSSMCTIKEYTGLTETDLAREVLEQVWTYMDEKDERSWDWQTIARDMLLFSSGKGTLVVVELCLGNMWECMS